jgi:hypothetical protein
MSFQDKSIQRSDDGQKFTFTAGEQESPFVALRKNSSVVPRAAGQERHRVTEALATGTRHDGKGIRLLDTPGHGVHNRNAGGDGMAAIYFLGPI